MFLCDTYVRGYIYGTSAVQCIINIGETSRKTSFGGGEAGKNLFFGKKNGKNLFVGKKAVLTVIMNRC